MRPWAGLESGTRPLQFAMMIAPPPHASEDMSQSASPGSAMAQADSNVAPPPSADYRDALLTRILQRKQSFSQTAGKRYLLYLGQALTKAGIVLKPETTHHAAQAFQDAVSRMLDSQYIGRLLGSIKVILKESAANPELGILPGPKAENIAHSFLKETCTLFQSQIAQDVGKHGTAQPDVIKRLGVRFHEDMQPRVHRLNADMVELYCLMHQSLLEASCKEEDTVCPNTVPKLLDAFGRGMLYPVEQSYGIDSCSLDSEDCFPRELCGPVLEALKDYLIGYEKYDATNRKFIKSIYKYCGTEQKFDRNKLAEYFIEPNVLQYILAYLIYILKLLCNDSKLSTFSSVVTTNLRESQRDETLTFRHIHLRMLQESWAMFCLDHIDNIKGKKKAAEIIQTHLPGIFIPIDFEEEENEHSAASF